MKDTLFTESLKYFFLNNDVVLYSVGPLTAFVLLITFLTVIRKWGESY